MNEKQREKAWAILQINNMPLFNEDQFKKQYAFNCQIWAMQTVDLFNLPYRVLLNYYKRNGYNYLKMGQPAYKDGVVLLNRLYPAPGYLIQDLVGVNLYIKKDVINTDIQVQSGPFDDDRTSTNFDLRIRIKDGTPLRREVDEKANAQITWDLSTQEGLEKWRYEFAHFLGEADLNEYSDYDYWGTDNAPDNASERIAFWKSLQADYHLNPCNYRQEEPTCNSPEDYTLWTFYWADKPSTNESDLL